MKELPKTKLSTNFAEVYFSDGIFYSVIKPDYLGTLEELKEHLSIVKEHFSEYFPICSILIHQGKIKLTTKEYRDYVAGEEVAKLFIALGIIMENSPIAKITGNLFLRFSRPMYPTRIFTNLPSALEWLKQYQSDFSEEE